MINGKKILFIGVILVVGFVVIQFVPYGRDHTNPAVGNEPNWSNPQMAELVGRACGDCHSNKTVWPWYANVAPVSWLVQHDVEEGRMALNFSDWGHSAEMEESEELVEVIEEGEMPPAFYLLLHPNAKLTASEKKQLIQELARLSHTMGK